MPLRRWKDGDGVCFEVNLQPRARCSRIEGLHGDALKVRVSSPPEKQAANRHAVKLIASALEVPFSSVEIVGGAASRRKIFRVAGLTEGELVTRLGG